MGEYVDLLSALPRSRRDVASRKADRSPEVVTVARQYGREYFDGDRKYGYGGYYYDGRWMPVAAHIMAYYGLQRGSRVLDVGCAKGFLVRDLRALGIGAYGIDISRYAVVECPHPDIVGRLHLGPADNLPFPADSFDLVISINAVHNLPYYNCRQALEEITRVSRGQAFVAVDSYRTLGEKKLFEDWVLTAEFHGYPDDWLALFAEAGYCGDYAWTVIL